MSPETRRHYLRLLVEQKTKEEEARKKAENEARTKARSSNARAPRIRRN